MMVLATSAALVGLIHSLAPGHWLPVVLMGKSRKWSTPHALIGALVTASGHVFISILLGAFALKAGAEILIHHEEWIERYAGLGIAVFGAFYALFSFKRHSHCHGHTHHGPVPKKDSKRSPYAFLFLLGFSPCVAVLPVFVAAAPQGVLAVLVTMMSFAGGVVAALVGATLSVHFGVMKLDHPIFEHYGDVITGAGVFLMGMLLFFVPELFHG